MDNVEFLNRLTKETHKEQAKYIIENGSEIILHEIKKFLVIELIGICAVINKESFMMKYFYTEEEALNYCLDNYKNADIFLQKEINNI